MFILKLLSVNFLYKEIDIKMPSITFFLSCSCCLRPCQASDNNIDIII